MILLTLRLFHKIFLDVINEKSSFEEVSTWALEILEKYESNSLEFDPPEDISKIISALTFLGGLNLMQPGVAYIYSIVGVKDEYIELFSDQATN